MDSAPGLGFILGTTYALDGEMGERRVRAPTGGNLESIARRKKTWVIQWHPLRNTLQSQPHRQSWGVPVTGLPSLLGGLERKRW